MKFINLRCKTAVFLICIMFPACSTVKPLYTSEGYTDNPLTMIKHVRVIIHVPDDKNNIAPLVSEIAKDMLKLRTNYFVDKTRIISSQWSDECNGIGGVILFTVDNYSIITKSRIKLDMNCELYDCSTKKLLWKAIGSAKEKSDNPSLTEMTDSYERKYPGDTALFASPLFLIIQDFIDIIPNPELTDKEIDMKIKQESEKSGR